jgi:hypothetical protein
MQMQIFRARGEDEISKLDVIINNAIKGKEIAHTNTAIGDLTNLSKDGTQPYVIITVWFDS